MRYFQNNFFDIADEQASNVLHLVLAVFCAFATIAVALHFAVRML